MKKLCPMLASVLVFSLAVSASATSQFSNNIQDIINEKNANLSGNVNTPPETAVAGDDIGSAIVIDDIGYIASGNTCGFTDDYDESCPYTGSTSPDVVYSYSPTTSLDLLTVDLCTSSYDTKVYIYVNAAGNLIACNDDACSDPSGNPFRSKVECVNVVPGNTYYIVVDGYFGDCGEYEIFVTRSQGCPGPCGPEYCTGTPEGEPDCYDGYSDAFNGGCNSTPNVFSPIVCGETVCGAGGNYRFNGLSYRDTDWYELDLPVAGNVMVYACAEFDLQLAVVDGNVGCGFITIICGSVYRPAWVAATCIYSAPSGSNWIFVASSAFSGVPCGALYVVSVWDCPDPPNAAEATSWGKVKGLFR